MKTIIYKNRGGLYVPKRRIIVFGPSGTSEEQGNIMKSYPLDIPGCISIIGETNNKKRIKGLVATEDSDSQYSLFQRVFHRNPCVLKEYK